MAADDTLPDAGKLSSNSQKRPADQDPDVMLQLIPDRKRLRKIASLTVSPVRSPSNVHSSLQKPPPTKLHSAERLQASSSIAAGKKARAQSDTVTTPAMGKKAELIATEGALTSGASQDLFLKAVPDKSTPDKASLDKSTPAKSSKKRLFARSLSPSPPGVQKGIAVAPAAAASHKAPSACKTTPRKAASTKNMLPDSVSSPKTVAAGNSHDLHAATAPATDLQKAQSCHVSPDGKATAAAVSRSKADLQDGQGAVAPTLRKIGSGSSSAGKTSKADLQEGQGTVAPTLRKIGSGSSSAGKTSKAGQMRSPEAGTSQRAACQTAAVSPVHADSVKRRIGGLGSVPLPVPLPKSDTQRTEVTRQNARPHVAAARTFGAGPAVQVRFDVTAVAF